MRCVHISSAHSRSDTRILLKECRSLQAASHQVFFMVADGKPDEIRGGVNIVSVQATGSRLGRMLVVPAKLYAKAMTLGADLYHIHDPELIPMGLKLLRNGKRVIFDAHEDLPEQLKTKPYLRGIMKILLPMIFSCYEKYACKKFTGIISATPTIRSKFDKINGCCECINNYPIENELSCKSDWTFKEAKVCYIGGITRIRGLVELVESFKYVNTKARLQLAGKFLPEGFGGELKNLEGWQAVDMCGFLDRQGVRSVFSKSCAGIVTFLPAANHINSQPNKLFEYMSAGLPVIASHFPLWKEIVEGNRCGICVDPLKPAEIARAIDYIVSHPEEAESMGENGRKAVEEKYNWKIEERKLLDFYSRIIGE